MAGISYKANVVGLLLNARPSMEHRDETQIQTPLSSAYEHRLPSVVRLLARSGVDVESRCLAGTLFTGLVASMTPIVWMVCSSLGQTLALVDQAAVFFAEPVGGLFGLTGAEGGIFRRVVVYVY